jgi:uracil-DNA glycosylase
MQMNINNDWQDILKQESLKLYWPKLQAFLQDERENHIVCPSEENVFKALELTPLEDVKVVILGQDPYHSVFNGQPQAMGLSFSVPGGSPREQSKSKLQPSLRNMFKELSDDLGVEKPVNGDLTSWAEQGVLLLNAVLTVRAGQANSHKDMGWELFTDAIIKHVSDQKDHVVFVLWGNYARAKKFLIDSSKHTILESAHPSPLSAHNGFFGSRVFSNINRALSNNNQNEIAWVESGGSRLNAQTKSDLQGLSTNAKLGIDLSPEFDNIDSSIDWLEKQL